MAGIGGPSSTAWILYCPKCDVSLRMEESSQVERAMVVAQMRSGEISLAHLASDGTQHDLSLHPSLTLN